MTMSDAIVFPAVDQHIIWLRMVRPLTNLIITLTAAVPNCDRE